jgi:hypothetical protein
MKTYNCLVALGGDRGNTVPVRRVTAAELMVLGAIHGGGGNPPLIDIEEAEEEAPWGNRTERSRLTAKYGKRDAEGRTIVDRLWPGAGTQIFERLDELNLPDECFKPTARAIPAEVRAQREEPVAAPAEIPRRRRKKAETADPKPEQDAPDVLA